MGSENTVEQPVLSITPDVEDAEDSALEALSPDNLERLEALACAWGISEGAALNVVVSDAYDGKIAGMRDATG